MKLPQLKKHNRDYYTTAEVASILDLDEKRVTRAAARLRIEKFAGKYVYVREDVDRISEYIKKVDVLYAQRIKQQKSQ